MSVITKAMGRTVIAAAMAAGVALSVTGIAGAATSEMHPQTSGDCLYYLQLNNYTINSDRATGCNYGQNDGHLGQILCNNILLISEVSDYVARQACILAAG